MRTKWLISFYFCTVLYLVTPENEEEEHLSGFSFPAVLNRWTIHMQQQSQREKKSLQLEYKGFRQIETENWRLRIYKKENTKGKQIKTTCHTVIVLLPFAVMTPICCFPPYYDNVAVWMSMFLCQEKRCPLVIGPGCILLCCVFHCALI